jgi:phosphate:Na+ symporter
MVTDRLETAISILATRDVKTAITFLDGKEQLDSWCRASEIRHYQRLKLDKNPKLDASSYYLDTMNNLRKINSHLTSIGYAFTKPVIENA